MDESQLLKQQGFLVLKKIGEGSYGQIFAVHDPQIGIVAAKVMKNEDFLENEWNISGPLSQGPPHIRKFVVNFYLAQRFDRFTVILMDYCNMGTLFDLINTQQDLPIPVIRKIMKQILTGLSYIHSKGIIHRDIKGGNILLHSPPGSGKVILKIADFGEAIMQQHVGEEMMMDKAGTYAYMPPELLLADQNLLIKADEKIDVWAAGMLLYQLFTRSFPFNPHNENEIMMFEK
ncbi:MAG: putative Protein tyrosine kinase [Streblomastix strix]|uniref:Protein kinase domain-containing protein n=1 Tax=Streblomastix strix TaxID=222440 RepID=A0A5J4V5E9_9EUKA|nr:MAG: putative Protein tyrosine kinase [Streblomastix strix]